MVQIKNYLILLSAKEITFSLCFGPEGFVMAISGLIGAKKFDY